MAAAKAPNERASRRHLPLAEKRRIVELTLAPAPRSVRSRANTACIPIASPVEGGGTSPSTTAAEFASVVASTGATICSAVCGEAAHRVPRKRL
jgi:hypothetical protein